MKAHVFGGELHISSVWKLLVAGYVCMSEIEHAFSTCSSPALKCLSPPAQNTCMSSAKNVRLQHKTRACPAPKMFVSSTKRVCQLL